MNRLLARLSNFWLCTGRLYDIGISLVISSLTSLLLQISSLWQFAIIFVICWVLLELFWYSVGFFGFTMMKNPTIKKHFLGGDFRKK